VGGGGELKERQNGKRNKKKIFPTDFKLLSQTLGNTINYCDFFKVLEFLFMSAFVCIYPGCQKKPSNATGDNENDTRAVGYPRQNAFILEMAAS